MDNNKPSFNREHILIEQLAKKSESARKYILKLYMSQYIHKMWFDGSILGI